MHLGQFGGGVLTYFRFLRWLVELNFYLFVIVLAFIIIPGVSESDCVSSAVNLTHLTVTNPPPPIEIRIQARSPLTNTSTSSTVNTVSTVNYTSVVARATACSALYTGTTVANATVAQPVIDFLQGTVRGVFRGEVKVVFMVVTKYIFRDVAKGVFKGLAKGTFWGLTKGYLGI